MRRNALVLFFGLFGLILQSVFVRPPLVICNIAILVVVFLALERSFLPGAIMAMTLGYLSDVVLGTDRGLFMLTLMFLFILVRFFVARFQGGQGLFVTLISATSAFLATTIAIVLEGLFSNQSNQVAVFSLSTVAVVITGAALGYPVYKSLMVLEQRFHEPEDDFVFKE